uniref:Purple acid phosphatase n=1 Tax=Hordeum vulgare subsp. vulgare TaxID=112509 RepID=A0A8I6YDG0_HORVV
MRSGQLATPAPISLLIITALLCAASVAVDAARQVPDDGGLLHSHDTAAYTTLHEGTTSTVMAWTAQLPAGPSPRGPGH